MSSNARRRTNCSCWTTTTPRPTPTARRLAVRGFGASGAIVLLLPLVYKAVEAFVAKLGSNVGDDAYKALKAWWAGAERPREALDASVRDTLRTEGVDDADIERLTTAILAAVDRRAEAQG